MKFLIICALVAVTASAPQHFYGGHLAAPISYGHSFGPAIVKTPVYAAPAVAVAPVVKHVVPAATSYQTFNQVHVTHPQPIVKYAAAPVVKYAAPVAPLVHAPAYAAGPVYSHGFGNVYGHGY